MAAERATDARDSGSRVKLSRPDDREERQARALARKTGTISPLTCTACQAAVGPCPACAAAAKSVPASASRPAAAMSAPTAHGLAGPGERLPVLAQAYFEQRLGADLGAVRLHHDGGADHTARSVGARAFTLGSRIGFARDAFRPHTPDGLELLGHELVHTLQPEAETTLRRDNTPASAGAAATSPVGGLEAPDGAVGRIAQAIRQGDIGAAVPPLRGRDPAEIVVIRGAVHEQTHVWLERWLVAGQRRSESIDTAVSLARLVSGAIPGGAVLGLATSLIAPSTASAAVRGRAEEGIRLLWPALPLIERMEVYDEGYREIEQAQLDVIRAASATLRSEATTAANSARLNRVLEHLDPKEEFDARVLLDSNWTYDAAERLLRRAPGVLADEEDAVFDALIALRPVLRRRFFDAHFMELVRLLNVGQFRLVAALARGTEAQALIIRLRLATEGRIDDQAAIQSVVDRAVTLLAERRDLRVSLASTALPAADRSQAQDRLAELDDLDTLLRFQRGAGGDLAAHSYMGLLSQARGGPEALGADTARLAAFVSPEQARNYALESAKQRILLAAGDVDAIRAVIMGLHAPPVELPADATRTRREGEQHRADIRFRQDLLADRAVDAVVRGLVGSEQMLVQSAVQADRFDEVLARLNLALNAGRYGEFFHLILLIARDPDWRARYQATSGDFMGTYARVQGTPREIMLSILRTRRMPLDQVLAYSGNVELLRTAFEDLEEGERGRLRLGYALSRGPTQIGALTQAEDEALRTFRDFETRVRASQTTLGSTDQAGIEAVLGSALGAEPTADELRTGDGRYRAAAVLHHRITAREALGRGASAYFTESDETMLGAAREFQALWAALGDRRTLRTVEYAAFLALYQRFESRTAEFTAASNAIGEMAGMVAATVAGVIVVAATGGAAAPGVIAMAAAAGGGARVVTREMFGDQYYNAMSEQGARDLLLGAIDGALAVASASLAARGAELLGLGGQALTAGAARIAGGAAEQGTQSLGRRVAASAVEAAIDGAIAGSISEAFGAMTDARNWRRGIYNGLVRVGQAALIGGLTGLAGGALIGAALPVLGRGARWTLDAVSARRIEAAVARSGASETLTAARQAARAGDLHTLDRLAGDLTTHLSAEDAQLLRRQLYSDLETVLGHPPGTAAAASPEQARLLGQSSTLEGDALSAAQREAEIDLVRRSEPRPSTLDGYVDEVALGNGHSWRRQPDGTWCRFTRRSLCGTSIPGARGISPAAQARMTSAETALTESREMIALLRREHERLPAIWEQMRANRRAGRPLGDGIGADDLDILASQTGKDLDDLTLRDVGQRVGEIEAARLPREHPRYRPDSELEGAFRMEEEAIRRLRESTRDPYATLRSASPSAQVRDQALSRARGVDQVTGLPPRSGALEADHIVPLREIYDMPGFARPDPNGRMLGWDDQVAIANDLRNLRGVDASANRSRQDWAWADWPGRHEHYPPDAIARMARDEESLRAYLQAEIQRRLTRRAPVP